MGRCWVSQKVTSQKLFSISFRFNFFLFYLSILHIFSQRRKNKADTATFDHRSNTGLVNLYSPSLLPPSTPSPSTTLTTQATPLKTLSHLTTPITSLSSHPSSSILCISSSTRKDQLKLYHLPTGNAFSNWPTQGTPLGRVTTTGFSESGEWLGVGNAGGKVLLWSLRHWA